MNYIENTVNDFFDNVQSVSFLRGYEVYEKDNTIIIELKVPGFSKKDISIDVEDNILHIIADSGNRDDHGFRSQIINKKVSLPNNVDMDNIEAKVKDGLLNIHIPRLNTKKKIKIS